ncbi:uncharacterized protein LACBIDRAFT_293780 [Laccaria bicolor S238N-H82]|uniref:Predicted protein n=1 Tax=Laccaria bicolor (strain S238N-H82 / ATCC MYA-4686) TaxID=486041 RepID=B0D6I7_LACBS|nr:uncharacterized protein LACBIDRAFT_293780 [Laccaria bicolor S238N-H82]EDR09962.1 predicted protein [Laccaria bicolor S238N-H82]|eukprot:XP_001879347.1 predicted protein [Laccaria bicolor S238N-H82]
MLTLICIGNHEHRHPDGSPGGQARIFHLVKPHHVFELVLSVASLRAQDCAIGFAFARVHMGEACRIVWVHLTTCIAKEANGGNPFISCQGVPYCLCKMVKSKRFWCIPLDGGSNEVFAVDIGLDQPVFDLKVMIKASLNRMRQYDAQDIPLYKLNEPVLVAPAATLLQRIKAQGEIEDIAVKMKEPSESLGDVFPGGASFICVTVYMSIDIHFAPEDEPGPPFKRARLTSPDEIPDWLQELHKKIWNRKDLRQELFRSVTLTLTDYNRLQESMTKLYLNVQEEDCWNGTAGVVTARLAALQSSNNCLVTDHGPHRIVQPINHNDDQTEGDDEVDEELGSLFPFALEYLDLSSLNLQSPPPCMPMPLLIRKEYHILSKMLNDLPQDGRGSAIITGQPGIGKTAYLYYRLIQSMLAGTRCLFQPIRNEKHENTVYLIAESSIEVVNSWSTEGVVAFFDADGPSPRPAQFIIDNHYIKIIGACLPNVADEKWTTKMGNGAVLNRIVTTLWSRQELYITGMFLAVPHLPYSRLQELTTYFGFNPRTCFNARLKPHYLLDYLGSIEKKIDETAKKTSLESIWRETCSRKSISHSIFQISPKDDRRMLSQVTTAAISPWALTTLLKIYEHRQADASFEFYNMIKDLPDEGTIRGAGAIHDTVSDWIQHLPVDVSWSHGEFLLLFVNIPPLARGRSHPAKVCSPGPARSRLSCNFYPLYSRGRFNRNPCYC